MKRVGIDIGSTTVKIAVLDDNNNILFSAYERHYANIQETLRRIIETVLTTNLVTVTSTDDYRFRWSFHFKAP